MHNYLIAGKKKIIMSASVLPREEHFLLLHLLVRFQNGYLIRRQENKLNGNPVCVEWKLK